MFTVWGNKTGFTFCYFQGNLCEEVKGKWLMYEYYSNFC